MLMVGRYEDECSEFLGAADSTPRCGLVPPNGCGPRANKQETGSNCPRFWMAGKNADSLSPSSNATTRAVRRH